MIFFCIGNIKRDFSQSNANKLMKYVGYNSCKADWNFYRIERGPWVCVAGPARTLWRKQQLDHHVTNSHFKSYFD